MIFDTVMPLAAIWLNDKVTLGDGRRTVRITCGDLIKVKDESIVDSGPGEFTHEIIECRGKMYSDFSITCRNLLTERNEIINL